MEAFEWHSLVRKIVVLLSMQMLFPGIIHMVQYTNTTTMW